MVKFIIIRHGFSEGNKEKRFSGQMDHPLDKVGKQQAESVSKYVLENFEIDCVYSSDLSRAVETVKPIADELGLDVITEKNLREVDVGIWQDKLFEEVEKEFPDQLASYRSNPGLFRFDGGESYEEMMNRGQKAFEKIAGENDGKTIVVGTHGGLIRTLCAAWNKIPLDRIKEISVVPNASVTVATYDKGNINWLEVGYADYLDAVTKWDA